MISQQATVQNARGIHVRPATLIVASVKDFHGKIEVCTSSGKRIPLTSILYLLSLGLSAGETVTIEVTGENEEAVCTRLVEMFAKNYDFPDKKS